VNIFKKYVLNFLIWWYIVQGIDYLKSIWRFWLYMFMYLKIGPMLSNLFVPLYQDTSLTGRLIAFPIRLTWAGTGIVIETILLAVLLLLFAFYLLIPVLPVIQLALYLFRNYEIL